MALSDFLFGKKEQVQQVPTMGPEQQQLLSQLLGGLGGPLSGGLQGLQQLLSGDTEAFEKPLMSQFFQQTVPSIAERFTGLGAGAQGSSAFTQQLGQAGAGLSEQLGALRGGLQQQGLGQLQGLLGQGLGARPSETVFRPGGQGFLGALAPGFGQAAGQAGGFGLLKLLGIM